MSHTINYYASIWKGRHLIDAHMFLERGFWLTSTMVVLLFTMEWTSRRSGHALASIAALNNRALRWTTYLVLSLIVLTFSGEEKPFFYFQF